MNRNKVAITLGLVCIVLTIAIVVQMNTIKGTSSTVAQTLTEDGLRDEVLKAKEKYDNTFKELENAEKELAKVREKATQNNNDSEEKAEQIKKNNRLLGLTNLEGEGIEITLKDDPNATRESISVLDDISSHLVHDSDLRMIVNELKNAGAEAICINGQRVVSTTGIMCIGNVIKVNDEKVGSPFVIKAIGFPEMLTTALDRPGGFLEKLNLDGIVTSIKKSNKVQVPKYTGVISSKYMRTQK
ncbi:MAG: DUF881 domain-containing protein [Clostridia bacterium]